ncbi:SLC13 family permease [Entomomonas asaccharolytica]|uniref:DASS family sodium-coupled anion symporter n=1 Tax=Entomomonas asaccharolytica TaxID=2785331 RepID=A0A974NIC0_9GAMM|nr:DASS family sodium-coupled anion symporter [Entomomonas asaccharolytica]QQP87113.1 DASS family sodium-coupled anion symporter [Entomomonas asaccharolytica]
MQIPSASHMSNSAWVGFFLGPILLLICVLTPPPAGMTVSAWMTVGLVLLMAVWWATEAIPIPITSLLPIILIPLLGIGNIGVATAPYADPTIYLFMGGFVIGLALERWNLHKRIALIILLAVGSNPRAQVAGFMIATAFISMWVSNTATAIMMLPIGLSIIGMLTQDSDEEEGRRFSVALLLGIAYAASIGGVATLIGTPPNAFLAGYMSREHGVDVGFGTWMLLGLPVSIVMLILAWWWLTRKTFKLSTNDSSEALRKELRDLGPITRAEILVGIVFLCASMSWIFRVYLAKFIPGLNDTTIAIAAAVALFIIPANLKKHIFLMDWDTAKRLPWGVLLLFGGGLSLAAAIKSSELATWIATHLGANLVGMSILVMMVIVVTVILFLTEVTSNTATAATFVPLMGALALGQDASPMLLAIPTAIAASCAFMMPVATPPNAIVFGTGSMKITDMMKAGLFLNLVGVVVVTGLCYLLIGMIWSTVV